MITGFIGVLVAKHQEIALLGPVHQADFGCEDQSTGRFRANQTASDMKAVFGQQFIEAIPGDAARNLRISPANQVRIFVAKSAKAGVDFSLASALTNDLFQFRIGGEDDLLARRMGGLDVQPTLGAVRRPGRGHRRHGAGR